MTDEPEPVAWMCEMKNPYLDEWKTRIYPFHPKEIEWKKPFDVKEDIRNIEPLVKLSDIYNSRCPECGELSKSGVDVRIICENCREVVETEAI